MCGFVACVGREEALPILLESLVRLGERGHHAAGIAVQNGGGIERRRVAGSVRRLARLARLRPIAGTAGIAHVRWSTDEPATAANAHPHVDCHDELALALVGVVEGAAGLRADLERRGHVFRSANEGEALAHLIEDAWLPPLHLAVVRALERVEGRFVVAVMTAREPGRIVCASRGLPVVVGLGDGVTLAASGEEALRPRATRLVRLEEGEIAVLDASGYDILRPDGVGRVRRPAVEVCADPAPPAREEMEGCERGVRETPEVIAGTLRERLSRESWAARLGELSALAGPAREAEAFRLVAGGSSRPSSAIGARLLRDVGLVPADVAAARSVARATACRVRAVVLGLARSGEGGAVRRALRAARLAGVPALCLDGAPPASGGAPIVSRIGLRTGPVDASPSARAFAAEVTTLALLALWVGRLRGLGEAERRRVVEALEALPAAARDALEASDRTAAALASALEGSDRVRVVGTGYGLPAAREAARWLRLAGGLPAIGLSAVAEAPGARDGRAGEAAILLACDDAEAEALRPAAACLRAAGCAVLSVRPEGAAEVEADATAVLPRTLAGLQPLLSLIPIQRLACRLGALRHGAGGPGERRPTRVGGEW